MLDQYTLGWLENRAREKRERVASAIRAAVPGLINPEAWPWLTLAEAAINAIEEEPKHGHVLGDPQEPADVP